MLLDLREKVRNSNPIKYTLITVICIPFVLFGVGSYFSGGTAAPVAEVGGEPITQTQLDRAYQQQRQQLARMFGGTLPEAFDNEAQLRQQALDQLVSQQVLESTVAEQKFAVGDATLGREIRQMPVFQVDGKFDSETYESQLRASGMNVPSFEQSFRDDTALNQFRSGVIETSFTLPQEADRLNQLARQTRTVDAITLDFEVAREAVEVSDEDASSYFEENTDNYKFPQRAKIRYLELDTKKLADDIEVTEEDAKTYYGDNKASYMLPEQREASHILLSVDNREDKVEVAEKRKQLEAIKERLVKGEDFAVLARELSEDVGSAEGGGSLGVISPGAMVEEFETAVFALAAEGDVSDPVVSDFGVHLIKVDKITAEHGKPFEDVKDEITATVQTNRADSEFSELREQMSELVFDNPESLELAADATGLTIQDSDWLDSDTDAGQLSNPTVQAAIFSPDVLDEGNNSELIELTKGHVIALRVQEFEEPRPKTLDDVKEEIIETISAERAGEQLDNTMAEIITSLESGEAVKTLADTDELATAIAGQVLNRQSTEFDRSLINDIYARARPTEGARGVGSGILANGNRVAYALTAIDVPAEVEIAEPTEGEENPVQPGPQSPTAVSGGDTQLGGVEFNALMQSLRARADINLTP
ncbi:MAG: SurA N-terminal domain-containing protein [Granulosicoccus sp.]